MVLVLVRLLLQKQNLAQNNSSFQVARLLTRAAKSKKLGYVNADTIKSDLPPIVCIWLYGFITCLLSLQSLCCPMPTMLGRIDPLTELQITIS